MALRISAFGQPLSIVGSCEAHLFDQDIELYGQRLWWLKAFLRAEKKFGGIDELTKQIAQDAQAARTSCLRYKRQLE